MLQGFQKLTHQGTLKGSSPGSAASAAASMQETSSQLPVSIVPEYIDLCATLDGIFSAEKTKVDSGARKQLEEGDKAERTSESGEPMAVPRLVVPTDFGSLTSLLSVRMCEYASDAGIVGVACLWASFVEEIAWHWENKVPLPRVKAQTTIGFYKVHSDSINAWVKDGKGDINFDLLLSLVNAVILKHRPVGASGDTGAEACLILLL